MDDGENTVEQCQKLNHNSSIMNSVSKNEKNNFPNLKRDYLGTKHPHLGTIPKENIEKVNA